MPQLRDLAEFHDPDLHLPINGKKYRIPAPPAQRADELRALIVDTSITEADERAAFEDLLGPALDEMRADGIPDPYVTHAGRTALIHFGGNPRMGAAHWHFALLGEHTAITDLLTAAKADAAKAPKPNRASRRRRRR